jgi:hypothetical protein
MKRLAVAFALAAAVTACSSSNSGACGPVSDQKVEQLAFPSSEACAIIKGTKTCTEVCGADYDHCELRPDDQKALGTCETPPPGNIVVTCKKYAPSPC